MQTISLTELVTASAAGAERQMVQNVVASTRLDEELVVSLLISDEDLVALFDTILSMLL